MAKYLGRGCCEGCSRPVEVYADRNSMAYYKCGPCGRKVTHSIQRESAKFVAKIDRHADEDDTAAPARVAAPSKAAVAPAPAPTKAAVAPAAPVAAGVLEQQPPAAASKRNFLGF